MLFKLMKKLEMIVFYEFNIIFVSNNLILGIPN